MIKVILILAVLFVAVLWLFTAKFGGHGKHPRLDVTRHNITVILSALNDYREKHGAYPSEENGLSFLPPNLFVQGVSKEYRPERMTDPWGTPFRYRLMSGKPEVRAAGPDRQFDTQDDITN